MQDYIELATEALAAGACGELTDLEERTLLDRLRVPFAPTPQAIR